MYPLLIKWDELHSILINNKNAKLNINNIQFN